MNQKGAKIIAILALLGIIISIIGTGLIVIFSSNNTEQEMQLTPEQIEQIQELINSQSGTTSTGELNGSGTTIEIN